MLADIKFIFNNNKIIKFDYINIRSNYILFIQYLNYFFHILKL